jgi:hypothetical protein
VHFFIQHSGLRGIYSNRILWRAMKGPQTPYPEWAVRVVDED